MKFSDFKLILEANDRLKTVTDATQKKRKETEVKKAVIMLGRFQPPHAGHGAAIQHVMDTARDQGADHFIYTSGTHDNKTNPLTPEQKVSAMRAFFPGANVVHDPKVVSPFHAIDPTNPRGLHAMGYTHVTMVGGADRVAEYEKRMRPYVDHFKSFSVSSVGKKRVSGPKGVVLSGTAARQHATAGNYSKFKSTMPAGSPAKSVKALYDALRKPTPAVKKKAKKTKINAEYAISVLNFLNESRPRTAAEKTPEYYRMEYRGRIKKNGKRSPGQGSKGEIKRRGQRVAARRKAIASGKARVGDGKDVDHIKPLSSGGGNGTKNLRVISRSKNRSRNNN